MATPASGRGLKFSLFSGNSEAESSCPSIASLRPGSIALASDQLVPGDRIYSINGINTSRMRPDEVSTLLDNVDESALLEIQYSLPEYGKTKLPRRLINFLMFFLCK